jgi:hypothetical protein
VVEDQEEKVIISMVMMVMERHTIILVAMVGQAELLKQ